MARIYPLFSSSKGNATFVGNASSGILIDVGVSCKKLIEGLAVNGLSVDAVKAVFITHEHSDHIQGLSVFTKKTKVPVFAQKETLTFLDNNNYIDKDSNLYIMDGQTVDICSMQVSCFDTPHDTERSCGYSVITEDKRKMCVCTDLGTVTDTVDKNLLGSDLVLLESNYDEKMLNEGKYPYYLKKRISSDHGHLSNSDSSKQVRRLIENGTTRIILGHLSQENNTPSVAENSALKALQGFERDKDYILNIAPVATRGMVITF